MIDYKKQYDKETGFSAWVEHPNYGSFDDRYVDWLEKKLVLNLPDIIKQSEQLSCASCKHLKRTDEYCDSCFGFKRHVLAT